MPDGEEVAANPPAEEQQNEEPPADDKKEDPPKEEEKKTALAMPKNPLASEPYVESEKSIDDKYTLTPCCCCLCACSHDRVGDATCFGCLPIRCGIMFIALQIFALSIILITVTFFQLLNEYFPWWFVFITLLLLIPIAIAASMMVYFFAKDSRKTRVKMFSAVILSIISVVLWGVWQLIFFLAIYKRDTVYIGMGQANDETNYHAVPKRTYLFTILAEVCFICTWLTYYTCVANQYCDLMNESYDRQKREDDAEAERQKKRKEEEEKKRKEEEAAKKKAGGK